MWKKSKTLAACVLAAVWWSVFYPELCFSEETCAVVRTESTQDEAEEMRNQTEDITDKNGEAQDQTEGVRDEAGETRHQTESAQNRGEGQCSDSEEIDAADVWRASGDRIVIRSRLWEWCEENWQK